MTVMNKLRACMDNYLDTMPSVPLVAHDNVSFEQATNINYVKAKFIPTRRRPAVRGPNPSQRYQGLYRIFVYTPEATGAGPNLDIVDLILARFDATTDISFGGKIVSVDYAEAGTPFSDPPFYCTPVDIGWYHYT